jgi:hypothetical protein
MHKYDTLKYCTCCKSSTTNIIDWIFDPALLDLEVALAKNVVYFHRNVYLALYTSLEYIQHSLVSFGVLKCMQDCTVLRMENILLMYAQGDYGTSYGVRNNYVDQGFRKILRNSVMKFN